MGRGSLAIRAVLSLIYPVIAGPALAAEGEILLQHQKETEIRSSWIIGSAVQGSDGSAGVVRTLILDKATGRVTAVVLSAGGLLGLGGKEIGVDWNELEIGRDGGELSIDLSAEDAQNAPVFDFRQQRRRLPESPSTEPMPASELPVDR